MERKYNALRTIAAIMKVLGIIFAIITILLVLAACLLSVAGGASFDELSGYDTGMSGTLGGILFGLLFALVPIFTTGIYALLLYAGGEAILVHIDIEENTRSMVYLLRKGSPGSAPPTIEYPE